MSLLGAGLLFAGAGCAAEVKIAPERPAGETTVIGNPQGTAAEYSPEENAYILAGKLKTLDSYRTEVKGEVVASLFNYTQTITDVHIKNGSESFMQAISSSLLVKVGKQAFFKGDKVVMRDASDVKKGEWKDSFSVATLEEYRNKIGVEPLSLSNYILNAETIRKAELVSVSDGVYTCRYEIDPTLGTPRYAVKMMSYGGLNSKPEFSSCTLELTFKEDWTPVSLTTVDKYKVNYIGTMSCTSTLTETFYDIGKGTPIPDAELFRARLGDDVSEIDPGEIEKDPLGTLTDALLNMDLSGGVKLRGDLSLNVSGDKLVSLPVDAWLSFDLEKFASEGLSASFRGRAKTELLGIPVEILYPGDQMLYVRAGSTKYKYSLPATEEGMPLEELLGIFELSKAGENGNTSLYELAPDKKLLASANVLIKIFTQDLPADSPFKDISINEVSALLTLHKKAGDAGRVTSARLIADFNIASLNADLVVAEVAEELPSSEELAEYAEANPERLAENFSALGAIFGGLADLDWASGVSFEIPVPVCSDKNPDFFNELLGGLIPDSFRMNVQVLPDAFAAGDLAGAFRFRFDLVLGMSWLGVDDMLIFYENGTLTIVSGVADAETHEIEQVTGVRKIDVKEALTNALLNVLEGFDGIPSLPSTEEGDFDLLAFLADAAMNSSVERIDLGGGATRIQLNMSDDFTALLGAGYSAIWDMVAEIDMGDMEGFVKPIVLMLFDFDVETVFLRADFLDGALTDLSFRLVNDGEYSNVFDDGWNENFETFDYGFSLGLSSLKNMGEGEAEEAFAYLRGLVAAFEASSSESEEGQAA